MTRKITNVQEPKIEVTKYKHFEVITNKIRKKNQEQYQNILHNSKNS